MVKVFQILVPDNTLVSRIISCENQATELFVIDRADKKFVSDYSNELNKPALYILVNRDKKCLYVGETDDSLKRLKNHEAKDFWTEAIVFHSTTDTLSTTEVKWLEAKTYDELKSLGYYDLSENKQAPQKPPLKRNQIYTLEPIFEEVKSYICAAGFDIFLKKKEKVTANPPKDNDKKNIEKDKVMHLDQMIWLLPSSQKYFDLDKCFTEQRHVYWQIKNNFKRVKEGDKGYIYSSIPNKAIIYGFVVEKVNLPYNPEMDMEDKYSKKGKNIEWGNKGGLFALIKMHKLKDSNRLTLSQLKINGLKSAPQNAIMLMQKKYNNLLSFIEKPQDELNNNIKAKKSRRSPFKFSMIGLKPDDIIVFTPTNTSVTIVNDNQIQYNDELFTLTSFCKIFMPKGKQSKAGTYQGPDYFTFNGKKLTLIRKEKGL